MIADRLEERLAAGPRAPSRARRSLARLGDAVPPEIFEDLGVIVSDLVSNSARHAGLKSGEP